MKVAFGILIGVVVIGLALVSVFSTTGPKVLNNPNLQIGEVRGDHLGMGFKEYQTRHPLDCISGGPADCMTSLEANTYAGAAATKGVFFTSDGKLVQIDYFVEAYAASTVLDALKEKYGDNGCSTSAKQCKWTNGKATVRYFHGDKHVSLSFVDETLSDQRAREYQKQKERERKTDQ